MLTNPLVSVIVPNYNHARYLRQRLDSVFNQTYPNFEVILLDDRSQDNSVEILNSYENERITHRIYNQQNSGSTFRQWKKGLELAKGDLIWIAESDDWADVAFLEKMVAGFTENDDVAVTYCDMYYVDENGNEIADTYQDYAGYSHPSLWRNNHYYKGKDYVKDYMLNKCLIVNASAVLFKRESGIKHIDKVLDYREAGDWLFWNYLLSDEKAYVYYRANEKLNYFRHSLQSTRNYPNIQKMENGLIEKSNVIFITLKMLGSEKEKLAVKRREMLDWWSKDHTCREMLNSSFKRILKTPMFQGTGIFGLYKHYVKYRIKNISFIKHNRKKYHAQQNSAKN
ncbi:MAG TPA: hypothetical protein DD740_04770 [Chryseobacterium sp.]|nr:hypothetical protein [Chryseobacterium sp.]